MTTEFSFCLGVGRRLLFFQQNGPFLQRAPNQPRRAAGCSFLVGPGTSWAFWFPPVNALRRSTTISSIGLLEANQPETPPLPPTDPPPLA